jgi:hypothetical protein
MKVINGSCEVPVIYTAHHASHDFGEFTGRVALSEEQRIRFSDYGTSETVPINGIATLIAEKSRALGDLNRNPNNPGRFQDQDYGQPQKHAIWKEGQELTEADKQFCQANFYEPFHSEIVRLLASHDGPAMVIAWDNTAHYLIGVNEGGEAVTMKPFILSNRGAEESARPNSQEPTSCEPEFLELLAELFAEELSKRVLPSEIHLNLVMKGGYICRQYSTLRNGDALESKGISSPVQSLQLEYDTAITHDQTTLEPMPEKIASLRLAFTDALTKAYKQYFNGVLK